MRPFTVILGVILGTSVAIAFGLAVVWLVFFILSGEHPRLEAELPELARSSGIFFVLSVLSAAGFLGNLKSARWRWPPLLLLWPALALTGWYYWP